jgi:hypothetical protein
MVMPWLLVEMYWQNGSNKTDPSIVATGYQKQMKHSIGSQQDQSSKPKNIVETMS